MRTLKLYGPPLALTVWAVLWWIGLRTDRFVGFMLAVLAFATFEMVTEIIKGRRER